jgi:hypothetical protein
LLSVLGHFFVVVKEGRISKSTPDFDQQYLIF